MSSVQPRRLEYLSAHVVNAMLSSSHPHPHVCAVCEKEKKSGAGGRLPLQILMLSQIRLSSAGGAGVILTTMSFPAGVFWDRQKVFSIQASP